MKCLQITFANNESVDFTCCINFHSNRFFYTYNSYIFPYHPHTDKSKTTRRQWNNCFTNVLNYFIHILHLPNDRTAVRLTSTMKRNRTLIHIIIIIHKKPRFTLIININSIIKFAINHYKIHHVYNYLKKKIHTSCTLPRPTIVLLNDMLIKM